ncbi:STAS domain-containing protein [Streptacidiphilus sp. PAMC 29251]
MPLSPASPARAKVQASQDRRPVDADDDTTAVQRYRLVSARGELDLATTALLRLDLDRWQACDGVRRQIVDLGQATFLDAPALRVLCAAHALADLDGGWLRLVYTHRSIASLLETAAWRAASRGTPPSPTLPPAVPAPCRRERPLGRRSA